MPGMELPARSQCYAIKSQSEVSAEFGEEHVSTEITESTEESKLNEGLDRRIEIKPGTGDTIDSQLNVGFRIELDSKRRSGAYVDIDTKVEVRGDQEVERRVENEEITESGRTDLNYRVGQQLHSTEINPDTRVDTGVEEINAMLGGIEHISKDQTNLDISTIIGGGCVVLGVYIAGERRKGQCCNTYCEHQMLKLFHDSS